MDALDPGAAAVVIVAGSTAIQLFTTLLPDRAEIREADPGNMGMRADVRHGEIMSCLLTLGFGVLVGSFIKSALPIWVAAASSISMIMAYEITLNMKVTS
jgi:hypothetical protein